MGRSASGVITFGHDFGEEWPELILKILDSIDEGEYLDVEELIKLENPDDLGEWQPDQTKEWYEKYFAKRQKLLEEYPIDYTPHWNVDYPMHIISVPGTTFQNSEDALEIDLEALQKAVSPEAVERYKQWFTDRRMVAPEPKWLLTSYSS